MMCWTMLTPARRTDRRRPAGVLAVVLLMTALRGAAVPAPARPVRTHADTDEDSDVDDSGAALRQLTRVFGVEGVSDYYRRYHNARRHRSAPEYMTQLYDTVAYTDGISKTAAPYEADVVRGIPDKGRRTSTCCWISSSSSSSSSSSNLSSTYSR